MRPNHCSMCKKPAIDDILARIIDAEGNGVEIVVPTCAEHRDELMSEMQKQTAAKGIKPFGIA